MLLCHAHKCEYPVNKLRTAGKLRLCGKYFGRIPEHANDLTDSMNRVTIDLGHVLTGQVAKISILIQASELEKKMNDSGEFRYMQ